MLILVAMLPPGAAVDAERCERAFVVRDWNGVIEHCRGSGQEERGRLARAWQSWSQHRPGEALALAEHLLTTTVGADAAYLAGYIRAQRDPSPGTARGLLERALAGYQRAARHADASRAASVLSRVPRPEAPFDDELQMAQLAMTEAESSGDTHMLGRATGALAESYAEVGMERAARDAFLQAEGLTVAWPEDLAFLYFKHALFLLDLGTKQDLETALRYLDAAAAQRDRTVAAGLNEAVAPLAFAIQLNRADAQSQLGQQDAAERELAIAWNELDTSDQAALARIRLVKGYVAARRQDLDTAEAMFAQANDGTLDSDYRWRIALELARLYQAAGRYADAERAYRAAIEIIEQLRSTASLVELRPWILARRTLPYVELLELLVTQHRGVEALAVAESLHARAWLDVALARSTGSLATTAQALTAARIRQRFDTVSAPALDGSTLMALIGDREVLVLLAIGPSTWRADVAHGQVRFERLSRNEVAALARFRDDPDDQVAAELAGAALGMAGIGARRTPLYVIASGPLSDLPFSALRANGQYLVEVRPVARLPGLAALRCSTATWDHRMVLIGDSRGDLPGAATEVQRLAASSGGVAYVGPAATRSVLALAHGARLLHLAVHGTARDTGNAIVLADGNLSVSDVLYMDLDPEVVMLAGCATAASNDAESWDGFPSAFLAAGSRYVIATLRSVEDAAAAAVVGGYYRQPASVDPIERLAAAQRELMATLPTGQWASFAAWGAATCEDR